MRTLVRRALRLDEPARHLSGPQFLVACVIALQAAILWGAVARDRVLIAVIFPLLLLPAWVTPRAQESAVFRFVISQVEAALIAAFMTLARHFAGL